jgi:restriction system protein
VFVSSGGLTSDAQLEARAQEKRHVTLVDLKKLFDLWVEHYTKIPEAQGQLLPLQPVYFLILRD